MPDRYRAFGNREYIERGVVAQVIILKDLEPFPEDEITNEITHIHITAYGDDPSDPFIEVTAMTQERALEVWKKVVLSIDTVSWFE